LWSLIIFLIQRSLFSVVFIPHEDFQPKRMYTHTCGGVHRGVCYPLTKFWEILGQVDLFWDFDSLSKTKQRSWDLDPFLGPFWDLGICNGNGMSAHGFTHV
jgi:hypothetical protein